jgi:hypothetical protein
MTDQKKLKVAIRARSAKTGESYTAARRQVLQAQEKKQASAASEPSETPALLPLPVPPLPEETAPERAKKAAAKTPAAKSPRGQVNDESSRKATGHGLEHWFAVLDAFGSGKGHTALAAHLGRVHQIPGWYAQGITVAYERDRGLREMNQACSGGFQVSVTKTVPVPVPEAAAAFSDPAKRRAWLASADPGLKEALEAAFTGPKPKEVKVKGTTGARLRYRWGAATVEILMTGKPTGTSVNVSTMNLPGASEVEAKRALWKGALEGLHRYLAG